LCWWLHLWSCSYCSKAQERAEIANKGQQHSFAMDQSVCINKISLQVMDLLKGGKTT